MSLAGHNDCQNITLDKLQEELWEGLLLTVPARMVINSKCLIIFLYLFKDSENLVF